MRVALNAHRNVGAIVFLLLLSACGGGGDSGFCAGGFSGGSSASSTTGCAGCSVEGESNVIDDGSGSAARLTFASGGGQITVRATSADGDSFPSGANPGALVEFPRANLFNSGISFTLYNDGVVVSSASGGAQVGYGVVPGSGDKTYYDSVSTPVEFDAVEAQVTISGNTEELTVSVFEICGDR